MLSSRKGQVPASLGRAIIQPTSAAPRPAGSVACGGGNALFFVHTQDRVIREALIFHINRKRERGRETVWAVVLAIAESASISPASVFCRWHWLAQRSRLSLG